MESEDVLPRVSWMTPADNYILELLSRADIAANPSTIGYNIDYDNSYVSERCRILSTAGLLERVHEEKAMYAITELGESYLREELEKDDLEPLYNSD